MHLLPRKEKGVKLTHDFDAGVRPRRHQTRLLLLSLSGSVQGMKNTKSFLLAAITFLPLHALASDSTTCTKDKLERRVAVVSTTDKPAPCEVRYYRDVDSEGKVLWSAKNKIDYCNTKAQEFIQKLISFGWTCKGSINATTAQATTVETPVTPQDDQLKEVKKKKAYHRKNPKADTEAPAEPTAPATNQNPKP
jgi:hypothetical protein